MQVNKSYLFVVSTIIIVSLLGGCDNKKATAPQLDKSTKSNQVSKSKTNTIDLVKEKKPLVPKNTTIEEIPISEITAIKNPNKTLYFDGYKNDVKGKYIGATIGYLTDDLSSEKIILNNSELSTDHNMSLDRNGQLYIGQIDYSDNKYYITKVLKDGSKQKIVEIPDPISSLYFTDDKLYVLTATTPYSIIYSANITGGDLKKLGEFEAEPAPFIVAKHNNIMIINDNNQYRRVDLGNLVDPPIKGDEKGILIKDIQDIIPIEINNGFIYTDNTTSNTQDQRSIDRINIETSINETIIKLTDTNDNPKIIGIKNNKLYYTRSGSSTAGIYTSDLDGKNEERLNDISISFQTTVIEGNYIYFASTSDIWIYRLDGSANAKIVDTTQNKSTEDTDYLVDIHKSKYKVSNQGVSISELESAFLSQNYIYYFRLVDSDEGLEESSLMRSNLDGTNPTHLTNYSTSALIVD